jgi:hypothetical protein
MIRMAIALLLVTAALAGPSVAGEKKNAPKLSPEAKTGARLSQENIVKMKLRTVQPSQQMPPFFGGPPMPPPALPVN